MLGRLGIDLNELDRINLQIRRSLGCGRCVVRIQDTRRLLPLRLVQKR